MLLFLKEVMGNCAPLNSITHTGGFGARINLRAIGSKCLVLRCTRV